MALIRNYLSLSLYFSPFLPLSALNWRSRQQTDEWHFFLASITNCFFVLSLSLCCCFAPTVLFIDMAAPSSPVHNRRLLSARNIRMNSVELPDDNEKSQSSASASPCPSPVTWTVNDPFILTWNNFIIFFPRVPQSMQKRLLPTNLYVVLFNFKSRQSDELDLK